MDRPHSHLQAGWAVSDPSPPAPPSDCPQILSFFAQTWVPLCTGSTHPALQVPLLLDGLSPSPNKPTAFLIQMQPLLDLGTKVLDGGRDRGPES